MKNLSRLIVLAISSSLPLLATAGQWEGPLSGIVDNVIVKEYKAYSSSALTLKESVDSLCKAPSQSTLKTAQNAFKANALNWQKVQWLNFGPVTYFMRYYAFEYWPDKKGITQRQLRALAKGDPSVMDAPKFWTSASIAVRGLTALESLLYHQDFQPLTSAAHCDLLERVSAHHFDSAQAVSKQWHTSIAQDWVFNEESPDFDPEFVAFEQFLQQWLEHMSAVKDSKLEVPIGYNGRTNLKLAEFHRSGLSLKSIQTNLQSYPILYHAGSPSLYDIAKKKNPALAESFDKQLAKNAAIVLQFPNHFFHSDFNKDERIALAKPLIESISNSQLQLTNMVTQLGFHIGFNSRDGD